MKRKYFFLGFVFLRGWTAASHFSRTKNVKLSAFSRAFTLIETLVAVSILTVAVVAPIALAAQSLAAAYYARDQITAFNLAQEAVEAVRSIRDSNVLKVAYGQAGSLPDGVLTGIPTGRPFTVDTRTNTIDTTVCSSSSSGACSAVLAAATCSPLQSDGTFYGYQSGWQNTRFQRAVCAEWVDDVHNEMRLSVKVGWQTGTIARRNFVIAENLYNWVNSGSASQ